MPLAWPVVRRHAPMDHAVRKRWPIAGAEYMADYRADPNRWLDEHASPKCSANVGPTGVPNDLRFWRINRHDGKAIRSPQSPKGNRRPRHGCRGCPGWGQGLQGNSDWQDKMPDRAGQVVLA